MKPDSKVSQDKPPQVWIPYFVLGISLLLTAISTAYISVSTEAKDRGRFENAVQSMHDNIQDRLEIYINLLRNTSGLFAANKMVTHEQFQAYVEHVEPQRRYPGIQGVGYSKRVKREEKEDLVAVMRKDNG